MLNGIKFNSFDIINNDLDFTKSKDIKTQYRDLFDFQFSIIFNKESFSFNNRVVYPLNYRNILEEIKILLVYDNRSKYNFYFYLDSEKINDENFNLSIQHKLTKELLKDYLKKFSNFNAKEDVKRNILFEIQFYIGIKDEETNEIADIIDVFKYLRDTSQTTYFNTDKILIKSGIKKAVRYLLNYYQVLPQNQFWTIFDRPDRFIVNNNEINEDLMQIYKDTINDTYIYQKKISIFSVGLVGPNTESYSADDIFIKDLINENIIDNFEVLSFKSEQSYLYDNFLLDMITYRNNKDILLLKQDFQNVNNYVINELNFMENQIYSFRTNVYKSDSEDNYIIDNDLMPNYGPLRRIYNYGLKYNIITENIDVADPINNIITLYDDLYTDKIYILYNSSSECIIKSHYARKVVTREGEIQLIQPTTVNFADNDNVIIIIEDNVLSREDMRDLNNKVSHVIEYFKNTIGHIIKVLPGSYNKDLIQLNFYKLLRSFAYYMANDKNLLDELKNNNYLNILSSESENSEYLKRAKKDAIYNNFGAIINLKKKDRWTYEQYRNIVSAIYKVCLTGPTKENMQDAIFALTSYKNKIYELYKEYANPMFQEFWEDNLTFKFAIQIYKDLTHYSDADELNNDLMYLLDIIKPAQALFYIYIVFAIDDLIEIVEKADDSDFDEKSIFDFEEDRYGYNTKHLIITQREQSHTPLTGTGDYEYDVYELDLVNSFRLWPDAENSHYLYIDTTNNSEFKHITENSSGYAFFANGTILRIYLPPENSEDYYIVKNITIDANQKNYIINNEYENLSSLDFGIENYPNEYIEIKAIGDNKLNKIKLMVSKNTTEESETIEIYTWDFTYTLYPQRLDDLKGRNRTGYPQFSSLKDDLDIKSTIKFDDNFKMPDIGHFKCLGYVPEYEGIPQDMNKLKAYEYSVTPGQLDFAYPVHYGCEVAAADDDKNIYNIKQSIYDELEDYDKACYQNAVNGGYVKLIFE